MTEPEVAEMIEKYVEYVDDDGRPVHLRHFMRRRDDLPIVTAIAQLPIILADGHELSHGPTYTGCVIPGQAWIGCEGYCLIFLRN